MSRPPLFLSAIGLFVVAGSASAAPPAAPTATSQSVTLAEDTPKAITLVGTDSTGAPLTYTIDTSTARTRGAVSCVAQNCTYTPTANYSGSDLFYFRVSNGTRQSARATVNLTVTAVNDAPTVTARTDVTVTEDVPKAVNVTGTDVEGSSLTFAVQTAPAHGTTTVSGSAITYTPAANYNGSDTFTYAAYDGAAWSSPGTVAVTITAVNDRPTVANVAVSLDEDTTAIFTLAGSDVDGDVLTPVISDAALTGSTWQVISSLRGTFTVSGLQVTYTPPPDGHGEDFFTYTVTDGTLSSSTLATASVHVGSVNDAPRGAAGVVRSANGTPGHAVLTGTDVDGDALSYAVVTQPAHGVATVWDTDRVVYAVTDPGFSGEDAIGYRVYDGLAYSSEHTLRVGVTAGRAAFPLDTLPVDDTIPSTLTADGYTVMSLPAAPDPCQKSQSAQPTFEGSLGGASVGTVAVVAGHYNTLLCGRDSYASEYSSIYVIASTGTPGQFEARLLDDGINVEAAGIALDDGTLLFPKMGGAETGGGLVAYTPGILGDTAIGYSTAFFLDAGTDSSPLHDATTGTTVMTSATSPETCGDAADSDCGTLVALDPAGDVRDVLDEADGHHAWGSGGCVSVAGNTYCGFGPGTDVAGADYLDLDACAVVKVGGMPGPSTVAASLSVAAAADGGGAGCTPVDDLRSSIVNGGLVSDGTWLYALAYGSDDTDATTRVYQYDADLNPVQVFEIPAGYTHKFTNSFYDSLLVANNGRVYTTGLIDGADSLEVAVIELDPVTGTVSVLSGEGLSLDGLYGTGRLFVDELGDEVIVYVAGTTAVVTRLSDGATVDAFDLGATTGSYVASPVLLADGNGEADALLFVATDNTVTIVPDSGLYEDTDAPWPGPRRDPRMQATLP